jgi:hypothetical protein
MKVTSAEEAKKNLSVGNIVYIRAQRKIMRKIRRKSRYHRSIKYESWITSEEQDYCLKKWLENLDYYVNLDLGTFRIQW